MMQDVAPVRAGTDLAEAIKWLADRDANPSPVVDADNNFVGNLSDLIRRVEIDIEKNRRRWFEAVTAGVTLAQESAGSHGGKLGEIMTADGISITKKTPPSQIAALLERKRFKRTSLMRLVGVLNLASAIGHLDRHRESDRQIRLDRRSQLPKLSGSNFDSRNVTIIDGLAGAPLTISQTEAR